MPYRQPRSSSYQAYGHYLMKEGNRLRKNRHDNPKTVKTVKKILKNRGIGTMPELKHQICYAIAQPIPNTVGTAFAMTGAGTNQSLLPFVQGNEMENQYGGTIEGQSITLRKLTLRIGLGNTAAANGNLPTLVRFVLVEDKQPSTTPLDWYTAASTYERLLLWASQIHSPIQVLQDKTFNVLWDKTIILNCAGFDGSRKHIVKTFNLKGKKVQYFEAVAGGTTVYPSNRDYYFFAISDYPDVAPTMTIYTDMEFIDTV